MKISIIHSFIPRHNQQKRINKRRNIRNKKRSNLNKENAKIKVRKKCSSKNQEIKKITNQKSLKTKNSSKNNK